MNEAEIASRLERLERENQRLKRFGGAAVVILVSLAAIYATQPIAQVIRAHAFEVMDNSGKVRVKLSVLPDGDSAIDIRDARGTERAWMGLKASNGPTIGLADAQGYPRAIMNVSSAGFATISLTDQEHNVRTFVGDSGVAFYDSKGDQRVQMGINQADVPFISLSDKEGFDLDLGGTWTTNVSTGATQQTSAASIVMFGNDKNHRVIWQAP